MKLSTKGKTLSITLGAECTIINVEAHANLIRTLPEKITQILLKINAVAEMDTAYLQCIYSLKKEAQKQNILLFASGKSREFDRVCRLYGLEKIEAFSSIKKNG